MPRERSEQTRSSPVGRSGISDTGRGHVCPCGRQHARVRRRRSARGVFDQMKLEASVYEAFVAGKVTMDRDRKVVHYAGNCVAPVEVRRNAPVGGLFVTWRLRCRVCKNCLRAKQFYWARAAMQRTEETHTAGLRTWFGTLTFTEAEQREAVQLAFEKWSQDTGRSSAEWWSEPRCDERFRLVREVMTGMVQRYWKRLRKGVKRCERCYPRKPRKAGEWDHPPASFKYFLAFERHKSGLPHVHWLLHEEAAPILLKQLACAWPHGFVKIKVVKGTDIRRAGFYVSKYLGKAIQARQIASLGYAIKQSRPNDRTQRP